MTATATLTPALETNAAPSADSGGTVQPQHLAALELANRVRCARAQLKRQIGSGESSVRAVIADVPWESESMAIADLLLSQRRWGRARVRRFLATIPIPENKPLEQLTERQRNVLIERLG